MVRLGFWEPKERANCRLDPNTELRAHALNSTTELRDAPDRGHAQLTQRRCGLKKEAHRRPPACGPCSDRRAETKARRLSERPERSRAPRHGGSESPSEITPSRRGRVQPRPGCNAGATTTGSAPLVCPLCPDDAETLARCHGASTVGELRWLAYGTGMCPQGHPLCASFTIPKKAGGERLISAPMPRLKAAQHLGVEQVSCSTTVPRARRGPRFCDRAERS